ncbi:hypothetical protein Bca4012_051558 [Brassica carinata]|uniref:Uncharacterized protein n=2 Tax=Brassica TaxID=3705 RepID=A0A0D3AU16_BRAOL|nr:unnamed protein product [Brassica napus]
MAERQAADVVLERGWRKVFTERALIKHKVLDEFLMFSLKPENHGKLKLDSYEGTMFLVNGGYISDFDIFVIAYDLEIKAGACLRITKCSEFEYCPTPMEHDRPSPAMASRNSKADASLSPHVFFDDVVPEICIDTVSDVVYNHGDISGGVSSSPKSESKVHGFIEKVPARG